MRERVLGLAPRSVRPGCPLTLPCSLQARDRGASGDPSLPEIHRASDPEAAFPEVGEGDRPGFQNRSEVSERRHWRASGKASAAL